MALYALSFQVWAGSVRLTHFNAEAVPIFRSIAGTFRSSGRFFWPLGYAIAFGRDLVDPSARCHVVGRV